MKIPFKWLKDYLELPSGIDALALAEKFTAAGLEIDGVYNMADELKGIITAKVISAELHPKSDHLSICSIDNGKETLTVLCGAPNVAAGQIVAFAQVGSTLPGGITIGTKKTLGIESFGMLCSKRELGLDESDHSGIWVLPEDLALGEDIVTAMDLADQVLVVELTPNRSDCLGILNCAFEAAALVKGQAKAPDLSYEEQGEAIEDLLTIEVEDFDLCPRYVGRIVKGITIKPSPLWMQNYLLAAGMRPINNVVDIANFVMLEMNQPLHTFDYQQIADKKIIVRQAIEGETMQTLDGKDRVFKGNEILICDGQKPVCIGGVMGGFDTEVTAATVDVLIEAAAFNSVAIRQTARRLGIPSEASMRFEKGIDREECDRAAQRAVQLLLKYAGGTAAKGKIDIGGQANYPPKQVVLYKDKVKSLLGISIEAALIEEIMLALNFKIIGQDQEQFTIDIPSYRQDISLEQDLIEEIARIYGYHNIPAALPSSAAHGMRSEQQNKILQLRLALAGLGLSEAINYSFISPKDAQKLLLPAAHCWHSPLMVANPLNEEQSAMRLSLIPGLLHNVARNLSRRNLDIALFEMGNIFINKGQDIQPEQRQAISIALSGKTPASWHNKNHEYDFYYLKGLWQSIAEQFSLGQLTYQKLADDDIYQPLFHPGRSAAVYYQGQKLGVFGQVHPLVCANFELGQTTLIGEWDIAAIIAAQQNKPCLGLPKFPAGERDLAFVGAKDIAAADIEAKIKELAGDMLESIHLFDIYEGNSIAEGKRSLAYNLAFRHSERTLVDDEIEAIINNILNNMPAEWGLELRK